MVIKKTEKTLLLADMIEKASCPVYIILDDKRIELTESHSLLKLFRKYWNLEDVTEVTLETENAYFLESQV